MALSRFLLLLVLLLPSTFADFQAPERDLYLDDAEPARWQVMMLEQIDTHGWEYTYQHIFDFINNIFPKDIWVTFDKELREVAEPIIGKEITNEIAGIVQVAGQLGHNVTMSELEFFQLFYEILMQCTGILARDEHGHIIHGRNMDIGLPVQNITTQVNWKKHRGGKTIVTSTQYLGYLGIHTGMRAGGWSVQANERVVLSPGPVVGYQPAILLETVAAFLEGHEPVGKFLRETLLHEHTYEGALPSLRTTKLASPMYLIVGGLHNGTVLTRDRMGLAVESQDTSYFGREPVPRVDGAERNVSRMESGWWEVQTNWDPWVHESHEDCMQRMAKMTKEEEDKCEKYLQLVYADKGKCDDLCQLYSDGRSESAEAVMSEMAKQKDPAPAIMKALSTAPVLNGGTKFTSLMSASKDVYTTLVRENDGENIASDQNIIELLRLFVRKLSGIETL